MALSATAGLAAYGVCTAGRSLARGNAVSEAATLQLERALDASGTTKEEWNRAELAKSMAALLSVAALADGRRSGELRRPLASDRGRQRRPQSGKCTGQPERPSVVMPRPRRFGPPALSYPHVGSGATGAFTAPFAWPDGELVTRPEDKSPDLPEAPENGGSGAGITALFGETPRASPRRLRAEPKQDSAGAR